MEVIAAHAGGFGERVEARQFIGVFDEATGLLHGHRVLFGERSRVRTAPFARPKAGLFGCFAGRIELHVLTSWESCRARRTAIDTRRLHGIVEEAIRVPIAADHGRPTLRSVSKRR
jgi:hypothetical protein